MIRFIFLITYLVLLLSAENIKVFGQHAVSKTNMIEVTNGVFIKDNIIISADNILYNKTTSTIDAIGNVYINYEQNSIITGKEAYINLETKNIKIVPFFMFNFDDLTWMSGKNMIQNYEVYNVNNMITSTCNPINPDWKIISSSSKYNKKTKFVSLYNPTLYIKNIPILYLPYLNFSTDKTRRSGILRPIFGFSGSEGILFTLPYYYVLGDSADLEFDPTIRTNRGMGIYSTFRFIHSPTSYAEFTIGKFKDNNDYQKRYDLENRTHHGWSFLYTNKNIIYNDKLYMNFRNANDADYFYLNAHNNKFDNAYLTDKIITSQINYYSMYKDNYFGLYGKYFKDTTKSDNSDTMQLLPQVQYHRFTKSLFDRLLYSIDFNTYNYTRKTGYKAFKKSIFIPFSYKFDMLNNYLKFNIKENFNYVQVDESGDSRDNVAKFYTNDTTLKLYSLLSKKYKTFSHSIIPSISYTFNNKYYTNNNKSDYLGDYKTKKNIKISLEQYLLSDGLTIYHSLSQVYYVDNNSIKTSDLFNTLNVNYYDFYLNEKNRYSFDIGQSKYNAFTLGFNNGTFKLEGSHIYNYKSSESYDINGFYKFDKIHKIFADFNYDLKLKMQKHWLFGISMNKQCWNYSVSFKREIVPILTTNGVSGIIRKTIYFEVEFIPLGGIQQQYQLKTQKADE
jgi:LPS-assembly protein